MKLSIGQKLSVGSGIFIVAMTAMVAGAYVSLDHLKKLQDEGMNLVKIASAAQTLSGKGSALYEIIADGEINHQLAQTRSDWTKEKAATEALFAGLSTQVTTPQAQAQLEQAKAGYDKYVGLFENQMLPALDASEEMTPAIRTLDGDVDAARESMDAPLTALATDSQAAARAADDRFDALSHTILIMGTTVGLLALLLGSGINLFVVRHVSRPLKALAHLLHRLIGGEEIASVPDQSRHDEVGEVARAVSAFQQSRVELHRLEAEQAAARIKLEADALRAREVMATAEAFERKIKVVADRVAETARTMNSAARTLDGAARCVDAIALNHAERLVEVRCLRCWYATADCLTPTVRCVGDGTPERFAPYLGARRAGPMIGTDDLIDTRREIIEECDRGRITDVARVDAV